MRTFSQHMPEALSEALKVLHSGGVVVHATETCYGIAYDLTNPKAAHHLFEVKKRPLDQHVSALFPSIDAARMYVDISEKAETVMKEHLPGPLTVVLPRKKNAPPLWLTVSGNGNDQSIGVRISSHPFAQKLAEKFGKPIATTSANLHGEANPYSIAEIETQWKNISLKPDLLIDGGVLLPVAPSTVVLIVGDTLKVLRQGSLTF